MKRALEESVLPHSKRQELLSLVDQLPSAISLQYSHDGIKFIIDQSYFDHLPDNEENRLLKSQITSYAAFLEFLYEITIGKPIKDIPGYLERVLNSIFPEIQNEHFQRLKTNFEEKAEGLIARDETKRLADEMRATLFESHSKYLNTTAIKKIAYIGQVIHEIKRVTKKSDLDIVFDIEDCFDGQKLVRDFKEKTSYILIKFKAGSYNFYYPILANHTQIKQILISLKSINDNITIRDFERSHKALENEIIGQFIEGLGKILINGADIKKFSIFKRGNIKHIIAVLRLVDSLKEIDVVDELQKIETPGSEDLSHSEETQAIYQEETQPLPKSQSEEKSDMQEDDEEQSFIAELQQDSAQKDKDSQLSVENEDIDEQLKIVTVKEKAKIRLIEEIDQLGLIVALKEIIKTIEPFPNIGIRRKQVDQDPEFIGKTSKEKEDEVTKRTENIREQRASTRLYQMLRLKAGPLFILLKNKRAEIPKIIGNKMSDLCGCDEEDYSKYLAIMFYTFQNLKYFSESQKLEIIDAFIESKLLAAGNTEEQKIIEKFRIKSMMLEDPIINTFIAERSDSQVNIFSPSSQEIANPPPATVKIVGVTHSIKKEQQQAAK